MLAVTCNVCLISIYQVVTCSAMFEFLISSCHLVDVVFTPNVIVLVVGYIILQVVLLGNISCKF